MPGRGAVAERRAVPAGQRIKGFESRSEQDDSYICGSICDAEGKAMKSLPERIMEHAEATPICPAALLHLGQRAAVGQALSRLSRSGRLMRIRQGENGYNESFNGKLRDELLNGEIFYSLAEAAVLVEQWRREYNTVRPHSACGGFPPAPEAIKPSPWFLRMPVLHGPPQVLGLT